MLALRNGSSLAGSLGYAWNILRTYLFYNQTGEKASNILTHDDIMSILYQFLNVSDAIALLQVNHAFYQSHHLRNPNYYPQLLRSKTRFETVFSSETFYVSMHPALPINETTWVRITTGNVLLIEYANKQPAIKLLGHRERITHFFMIAENWLVSSSADATIRIWDTDKGQCLHVLDEHVASIRHLCQIDDDKFMSCDDQHLIVWSARHASVLFKTQGHGPISVIADNRLSYYDKQYNFKVMDLDLLIGAHATNVQPVPPFKRRRLLK